MMPSVELGSKSVVGTVTVQLLFSIQDTLLCRRLLLSGWVMGMCMSVRMHFV